MGVDCRKVVRLWMFFLTDSLASNLMGFCISMAMALASLMPGVLFRSFESSKAFPYVESAFERSRMFAGIEYVSIRVQATSVRTVRESSRAACNK